jgi:hypothetical protein
MATPLFCGGRQWQLNAYSISMLKQQQVYRTKQNETPLLLAIGLDALVKVNPGALEVPRKLQECDNDNDLLLLTEVYEDHNSVDPN